MRKVISGRKRYRNTNNLEKSDFFVAYFFDIFLDFDSILLNYVFFFGKTKFCVTGTELPRTSIENLSKNYRTSIEHLSMPMDAQGCRWMPMDAQGCHQKCTKPRKSKISDSASTQNRKFNYSIPDLIPSPNFSSL